MVKPVSFILSCCLTASVLSSCAENDCRQTMDLGGSWSFRADSLNEGIEGRWWECAWEEQVLLPGTTDTNRKGRANNDRLETTQLSRYYTYEGPAWYSREVEIPEEWSGRHVELFMERTRPSMVWVDSMAAGSCRLLSSPHRYNLTDLLTPGRHRITVMVDNGESIPPQIRTNSHACSESTQTNWNGIIGRIELQAMDTVHIVSADVFPDVATRSIKVKVRLSDASGLDGKKIHLSAVSFNSEKRHTVRKKSFPLTAGQDCYELDYPMGKDALLWSSQSPNLYRLDICIDGTDRTSVTFGLRDFRAAGHHFTINGARTFLRGKHDACVFPLTGHTPMDLESWRHYFKVCREYGLNHCRFHSWCPPEACFMAADMEGVYLQPELPVWGEFSDRNSLLDFLMNDGRQIQKEYGNHASFVLFALGNELNGDPAAMLEFINEYRKDEPRHLYALGSNIHLGFKGHIPGEDFLVTCRLGEGEGYSTHTRASFSFADAEEGGYLNNTYPNTEMNFDKALEDCPVPVIGHETGQFQIYPDYRQIAKYTGVLAPWNLEVFRKRLEEKGMASYAEDFFRASGAWAVELYRADIEMNLRSGLMAGFQLLDLQDYPGQGSAYVGILDAFMDSKGLVSPEKWRQFCSETVPLAIMEKYCWGSGDTFSAALKVADYRELPGRSGDLSWRLENGDKVLARGGMEVPQGRGLLTAGTLQAALPETDSAMKLRLVLQIEDTGCTNEYPVWVYPRDTMPEPENVTVARSLTEDVVSELETGDNVLLMPRMADCGNAVVGGLFQTDYWNYRMFRTICDGMGKKPSPGTLGILTDPEHPVFSMFPTEFHTDWQWYAILKNSYPLIMDAMPEDFRPIVQVIDNVERNHRLGLLWEARVGKGRLLVCMADLSKCMDRIEAASFYRSMLSYMGSPDFNPQMSLSAEDLQGLLSGRSSSDSMEDLKNISYKI